MQCPYCQGEIQDGATRCTLCGSVINAAAAPVPAPSSYKSSFGDQFNASLIIWKMNLGDLAILSLVLLLVIWIPIANIGFIAGYARSVLKVSRGEGRAEVGDLFNAWDCFGNLLVYIILLVVASAILSVVPLLGSLASLALGFVAVPGMYLIIDRKANFGDAFKWGIASIQARPADWLLSYIVGMVVSGIGALLLFVGIILTMPLGTLILAMQYESAKPT